MDRKKVMRSLKSARCLLGGQEDLLDLECTGLAYMEIGEAIEELEKPGWTAVSDALPDWEKTVLVCNGEEPEDMWFCHRTLRKDVATDAQGWCNYPPQREITHWRYIEPLKSERKP